MNALLIVTDDLAQRFAAYMPWTRSLGRRGVTFGVAMTETPVCLPQRANMLYGRTSAVTNIRHWFNVSDINNSIAAGTWSWDEHIGSWFPDHESLAVGKYMNVSDHPVPAGWDRWRNSEDDYATTITKVNSGDGYEDIDPIFHLDWLTSEVTSLASEADGPWLAYVGTSSPHTPHAAPRDDPHAWSHLRATRWPQDGTGWPSWITDRPRVGEGTALHTWDEASRVTRAMAREAWEFDQAMAKLEADGVFSLDDTLVIVTSDNGAHLGDHRLLGVATKNTLYNEACMVPCVMAGPGIPRNRVVDVPVSVGIDVPATLAAALDGQPQHPLDGLDLRAIAATPSAYTSRSILGRRLPSNMDTSPAADWVVQRRNNKLWKLARHFQHGSSVDPEGEEYELYDLTDDWGELTNLADDAGHATILGQLEAELDDLLAT